MILDPDKLGVTLIQHRPSYAVADPFPHAVIDGLIDDAYLRHVTVREFGGVRSMVGYQRPESELKFWIDDVHAMQPVTRVLFEEFASPRFLTFLEQLTGIYGLIPDPYLVGGGLHYVPRGGFLKIHADFNIHPTLRLRRRLNCLLYLNHDWQDEWGGHLELWNRDMTRAVVRVAPEFNRFVIFTTSDHSFHGHPDPLLCPEGRARLSIALYYYTADTMQFGHSTLYRKRPGE